MADEDVPFSQYHQNFQQHQPSLSPLDSLAKKMTKKQRQPAPTLSVTTPESHVTSAPSPLLHTQFALSPGQDESDYSEINSNYDNRLSPSLYSYHESESISRPESFVSSPSYFQRVPVVAQEPSTNYSRPTPPRTPEGERAKRKVLDRIKFSRSTENLVRNDPAESSVNLPLPTITRACRTPSPSPVSNNSMINHQRGLEQETQASPSRDFPHAGSRGAKPPLSPVPGSQSLSTSRLPSSIAPPSPTSAASRLSPRSITSPWQPSTASSYAPNDYPRTPQSGGLRPPDGREAPYDRYSWYELPSPTSPSGNNSFKPIVTTPSRASSPSKPPISVPYLTMTPSEDSRTADDYLTLGIKTHIVDTPHALPESARYFEISATLDGGCGFGMLMWGLCLRHGWGVEKDEKRAFSWLRKACEMAVDDLEGLDIADDGIILDKGLEAKGSRQKVKAELILAIYEVGQSFFHGWGVPRDRAMGFRYFLVAARLGDVDAQQELGFCYSNGKGCKKNRKEAAKWYRAAAEQGASTVGLAWIYKEKFA